MKGDEKRARYERSWAMPLAGAITYKIVTNSISFSLAQLAFEKPVTQTRTPVFEYTWT